MSNSSASARELVDKVLRNEIRLPEMQRGYVWKSTQVRDLIDSLYRGYPAGNILMWETSEEDMPDTRDFAVAQKDIKHSTYLLLLDGQQRVTSLSRLLQGETFNVRGQGGKLKEIDILFNMDHPDSLTNVDIEEDEEEAVKWYRKAAERGYAAAQYNLGFMYDNGRGVAQDYTKAVEWYTKSAEQGHARAQFNLGLKYANGQGVAQDYTKAVYWYTKSAEQGNAIAQVNLGNIYKNGTPIYSKTVVVNADGSKTENVIGIAKDHKKAIYWYTKAAEQGYENAIKILKSLK